MDGNEKYKIMKQIDLIPFCYQMTSEVRGQSLSKDIRSKWPYFSEGPQPGPGHFDLINMNPQEF